MNLARALLLGSLCLAPLLVCLGCASSQTARPAPLPDCAECRNALPVNGWCESCEIGYVAAEPITSFTLHEALDAHGHDIPEWSHPCLDCNDALMSDGYCAHCKFGFVDGQLYFTELTWTLGRGTVIDRSLLRCPVCIAVPEGAGWCERCERGLVGNVVFSDRALFDRSERQFRRLQASIEQLERCESCAVAQFFEIECGECRRRERAETEASPTPPK